MRPPTQKAVVTQARKKKLGLLLKYFTWLRFLLRLPQSPGHASASLHRQRAVVASLQQRLTRADWTRAFRMQMQDVTDLYKLIADDLYRNPIRAQNSSGSPILPETRLLMALRWSAGASYLDLMLIFGVSRSSFFDSLWVVFKSLLKARPIVFDMSRDACASRAAGFLLRQRRPVFRHAIGAVDGILVQCRCPSEADHPHPTQFWTRKGFFAFNVQAVCDANRRLIFISVDCPGSAHDSVALRMSTLGSHLVDIPQPYYLLADPAYKVFDRCLVPYEGRGRNESERNFNFFQSSIRMNIECTFGLLVARWGVLWRPLRCGIQHNILTIRGLAVLHNWCQERRAIPVSAPGGGPRGVSLDERPMINPNGIPEDLLSGSQGEEGARTEPRMNCIRRNLAYEIQRLGLQRPLTSMPAAFPGSG